MNKQLTFLISLTFLFLFGGSVYGDDIQDALDASVKLFPQKMYKFWLPLAEQGDADAQYNLGAMYGNGQGVPQDYKEAVKWFRLAAEQGFAIAQSNLGAMYEKGTGVPQDYKEAVKWYRLSAEQGFANAQHNLGVMYHTGQGVPQDYKEAVKWYRLSAEQGIADAQSNLGVMYHTGQGVPQDYKEAVKWYRLAAEHGLGLAQTNLGLMYAKGQGFLQNYTLAHMWFNIGGSNGDKNAVGNIKFVEKKMTPQQIEKAQEMARNWKPGDTVPNISNDAEKKRGLKSYIHLIRSQIASAKKFPEESRLAGHEGKARVQLTVFKNGEAKNIRLVTKSPHPKLNQEAIAAIKRAAPFPKFPDRIYKEKITIIVPFSFRLN
jgi:uncharacterized protein